MTMVSQEAMDQIFFSARSRNGWLPKPVPEEMLHKIYDAAVMGPTAANSQPQRIVFVTSEAAKAKLLPIMNEGNRTKVQEAPVTALFAYDLEFYVQLKTTFPHAANARSWYEGNEPQIRATAFRNASLQAAYFMLAARAYGLDCGPMSGFDEDAMNQAFFADTHWRINFVCGLGYGSDERLFPRSPRLDFDQVCRMA